MTHTKSEEEPEISPKQENISYQDEVVFTTWLLGSQIVFVNYVTSGHTSWITDQ